MTFTCIADRNFEEATTWAEKALIQNRHSPVVLRGFVVTLAYSGRIERAEEVLQQLLAMESGLTMRVWRRTSRSPTRRSFR
jgi:hypothetical protein